MNRVYWPALDGLRAIAVMIVLLAHAGSIYPRSGTIGVEIFFVMSGFLITYILHQEFVRLGKIQIKKFYLKRILRLLPCLFLTCFLFSIGSYLMYDDMRLDTVVIVLTYSSNWARALFNYDLSSLSHTWSLSLEEQYYLIWPWAVLLIEKRLRKNVHKGGLLLCLVILSSCYRAFMVETYSPSRIYFGLDTHADGLILGSALLYLTVDTNGRITINPSIKKLLCQIALPFSIILLGVIMALMDWNTPWMSRIGFLIIAMASSIIILDLVITQSSKLKILLSVKPLVYLGQISYGIYLLHLPLYTILDKAFPAIHGTSLMAIKITVSILCATISYYFVEKPFLNLKQQIVSR